MKLRTHALATLLPTLALSTVLLEPLLAEEKSTLIPPDGQMEASGNGLQNKKYQFYVGSEPDAEKAGLRVFDIDAETGEIRQVSQVDDAQDPIYLALSQDGKFLYAAQQVVPNVDGVSGGVAVYAVNGSELVKLAEYACAPTVPCHISLSHDGRKLVYAEYGKGWVGVFNVKSDGLLEGPVAKTQHVAGGSDAGRQGAAHCHCAVMTPDDSRLCISDLGQDRIFVYEIDSTNGNLREVAEAGFTTASGTGPRHLIFHPTAKLAFLVNEYANTVISLRHDGGGIFSLIGTYSMLPDDFVGKSWASAIKISSDGRWLLASNRGYDSIAVYAINTESGQLEGRAINKLNGSFPRDFEFTPDGKFIVVGYMLSNEVAVYRFDNKTGLMEQTANTISMIKPLCFVFVSE